MQAYGAEPKTGDQDCHHSIGHVLTRVSYMFGDTQAGSPYLAILLGLDSLRTRTLLVSISESVVFLYSYVTGSYILCSLTSLPVMRGILLAWGG